MPTLRLQVAPLANPERYAALAATLTRITAERLGKDPALTAVLVEDLPAAQWFVGGAPVERPTALLEITITAGTNTEPEKAAFIAQAFDALQRQLGFGPGLEPASYVIVRELPATDWGWSGETQRARQLARRQAEAIR